MQLGMPLIEVSSIQYLAEPVYLGGFVSRPKSERIVIESPEKLPEVDPKQIGFNIYWTLKSFSYNGVTYASTAEPKLYCRTYFNCEQTPFGVRDVSGNFHPFDSSSGDKIVFR